RILPPTDSAFAQTARLHRLPLKGGVNFLSRFYALSLSEEWHLERCFCGIFNSPIHAPLQVFP
ncbi:MAG: hypothetical protein OXG62_00725, partial [Nitrospinae bacterium]|nr:hypothetical protein [Nitrospinota bacterium]